MKFISWNVNGFRAVLKKGFEDVFKDLDADFFCLQETKMQEGQADFHPEGYHEYYSYADKKGYSGTAIFAKEAPLRVAYGIEGKHNDEGRVITLEYGDFYLICAYVPNSQDELKRIDYRMEYEDDLRAYMSKLDKVKPVVYCGDLNVAHEEIDLKNPKSNRGNAGFSDEERSKMTELLGAGFTDTYRPVSYTHLVHLFACLIKVHKKRSLTATPKFHKCVNMRRNNIQAVTPMPLERHSATAHQSTTGKR